MSAKALPDNINPAKPALALYQPDIAGNTGTLIRLCVCFNCELHLVEPAGFRTDDKALKRAGMDYAEQAMLIRHDDFEAFEDWHKQQQRRLVLLTTAVQKSLYDFKFRPDDILMLGRESSGVPEMVHKNADMRLTIPMEAHARSLNQAVCGAMALGEALRQTRFSPGPLPAAITGKAPHFKA